VNEAGELVGKDDFAVQMLRKELFGKIYPAGKYPPNTLLIVDRSVGEQFPIEVEAAA
jgi:hypothetical protein